MPYLSNPHDSLQDPCHRWLRCRYLFEYRLPPTPDDDAITHEAYPFLCAWQRCRDDEQREQVAQAHPALAEAHRLYQSASLQRAKVEARLLAGQDNDAIALKCDLYPAVVHYFHSLFFDVRPNLLASIYIINLAIGPKYHYGVQADDYEVLLKIAGYALGAEGVDELIAFWTDPPVWPVSLAQFDDAAVETLRGKLQMQAWILSLTVPADTATAARMPAIRQLLSQAGVLGRDSASDENEARSGCQPALDYRAFLAASETAALKAAPPASAIVAGRVGERAGPAISCSEHRQAMPA